MKLFEKEVAGQIDVDNPFDMCIKLFINNFEACILLFLGGASFGILTIFIMSLNGIVIGAIMEIIHKDHSWAFIAAALLPHGIFEIPALILASSAILYIGIMLVTPRSQSTLGEVFIEAIADWMKVGLGLVLPLLTIAAVVETWVTPVLLSWAIK